MPYIPPRNPNNLSDPDLLRTSKRAIEQYAQEYLHVQHPTTSATKLSRSRFEYSRIESRPKRSWHPEVYVYRPRCVLDSASTAILPWLTSSRILYRMDLCEDPDERTITAYLDLPGLKLPDVEIRLRDDILTVSGKRHAPAARYPFQELKYGAFRRSIRLPIGIQVYFARLGLGQLTKSGSPSEIRRPHPCPTASSYSHGQMTRRDYHPSSPRLAKILFQRWFTRRDVCRTPPVGVPRCFISRICTYSIGHYTAPLCFLSRYLIVRSQNPVFLVKLVRIPVAISAASVCIILDLSSLRRLDYPSPTPRCGAPITKHSLCSFTGFVPRLT